MQYALRQPPPVGTFAALPLDSNRRILGARDQPFSSPPNSRQFDVSRLFRIPELTIEQYRERAKLVRYTAASVRSNSLRQDLLEIATRIQSAGRRRETERIASLTVELRKSIRGRRRRVRVHRLAEQHDGLAAGVRDEAIS
jgi:hypothetical protein